MVFRCWWLFRCWEKEAEHLVLHLVLNLFCSFYFCFCLIIESFFAVVRPQYVNLRKSIFITFRKSSSTSCSAIGTVITRFNTGMKVQLAYSIQFPKETKDVECLGMFRGVSKTCLLIIRIPMFQAIYIN